MRFIDTAKPQPPGSPEVFTLRDLLAGLSQLAENLNRADRAIDATSSLAAKWQVGVCQDSLKQIRERLAHARLNLPQG